MPWNAAADGLGVENADAAVIRQLLLGKPINMRAGVDFTFVFRGMLHSLGVGANPGFWRSAGGTGTTFCIEQAATGRPWIRVNGTDVLKPVAGLAHPTNSMCSSAFVVRSASWAGWYLDGVLAQSATHATATANDYVDRFGWQSSWMEHVDALWCQILFYSRALTAGEVPWLAAEPYAMIQAPVWSRYFDFGVVDQTVTPAALALTLGQPAVADLALAIAPAAQALTLGQPAPAYSVDEVHMPAAQALTLAQPAPMNQVDEVHAPAALALTLAQPAMGYTMSHTVTPAALALQLGQPVITIMIPGTLRRRTIHWRIGSRSSTHWSAQTDPRD
jgi:hypothetical protein